MRKLYIFLATAMMATAAVEAATPTANTCLSNTTRNILKKSTGAKRHHKSGGKSAARPMRMIAESELPDNIISELPEGATSTRYVKSGITTAYNDYTGLSVMYADGFLADVAITADNKIYISNPFAIADYEKSYIVGDVENGVATFTFPQYVADYYEYDEDYGLFIDPEYAMLGKMVTVGGEYDFEIADNQTLTFNIEANGTLTCQSDDMFIMDCYLSYEDDSEDAETVWAYTYLADAWSTLKPLDAKTCEVPDDLTFSRRNLLGEYEGYPIQHRVDVAVSDDVIYVKGLFSDMPEAVISGTIKDNTIEFPADQYLGVNEPYYCTTYFIGSELTSIDGETVDNVHNPLTVAYDAEEGLIDFGEYTANLTTCPSAQTGGEIAYYIDCIDFARIVTPTATVPDAVEPPVIEAKEYAQDGLPAQVAFTIPRLFDEVNLIDSEHLYYRIYIDGELYTVSPDIYFVDEEMTEIPYDFIDDSGEDIMYSLSSGYRWFTIYADNASRVGVQAVYDDGTTHLESEIVTTSVVIEEEGAIENVTDASTAKSMYYDLQGRRVTSAAKGGIYIRRTLKTDGSASSTTIKL